MPHVPNLRPVLVSLGVAALAVIRAGHALACGALPCGQLDDVLPPDGSVGLPLNTEIRILYFGALPQPAEGGSCEVDLARLRLVPRGGAAIELTGALLERSGAAQTWVVAKPSAALAANTTYAVQLEMGAGIEVCRCDQREWTTVSTFATGAAADDAAPTFTGVSALSFGERADSSSDCGESKLIPAAPAFTPASDASPALRYNLYVDGAIAKRYVASLTGDTAPELYVDCGTGALTTATLVAPGARLEARAVDIAGNESAANASVAVTATCAPLTDSDPVAGEPDAAAGDPEAVDTAAGDPRIDVIATPTNSGCALSSGAETGSSAALAALLAAWVRWSLRRRSAR